MKKIIATAAVLLLTGSLFAQMPASKVDYKKADIFDRKYQTTATNYGPVTTTSKSLKDVDAVAEGLFKFTQKNLDVARQHNTAAQANAHLGKCTSGVWRGGTVPGWASQTVDYAEIAQKAKKLFDMWNSHFIARKAEFDKLASLKDIAAKAVGTDDEATAAEALENYRAQLKDAQSKLIYPKN